jgi:hypothetical protein
VPKAVSIPTKKGNTESHRGDTEVHRKKRKHKNTPEQIRVNPLNPLLRRSYAKASACRQRWPAFQQKREHRDPQRKGDSQRKKGTQRRHRGSQRKRKHKTASEQICVNPLNLRAAKGGQCSNKKREHRETQRRHRGSQRKRKTQNTPEQIRVNPPNLRVAKGGLRSIIPTEVFTIIDIFFLN